MVGVIEEATVTLEALRFRAPLTLSTDGQMIFSCEEMDSGLRPTRQCISWDLQSDAESTDLRPPLLMMPMGKQHFKRLDSKMEWGTRSGSEVHGPLLQESKNKGVYTRLGYCALEWDYGDQLTDGPNGRIAGE
jgi:hypothetical protein